MLQAASPFKGFQGAGSIGLNKPGGRENWGEKVQEQGAWEAENKGI